MTPIVPYDCNPGSDDDGLLVYRSKAAAEHSATHQTDVYGDNKTRAIAVSLDSVE